MRNRTVWLTAALLIGFAAVGSSYAQQNLLVNGGFEDGVLTPWNISAEVNAEVVKEVVGAAVPEGIKEGTSCLHVTVNSAGANFWSYNLNQGGLVFEKGKKYTLSALLKCKQGTLNINFKPELGQDPWPGYGDQIITMTDKWAEYSVTTPVFASTITPGVATFHIGFAAAEFWMMVNDRSRWDELIGGSTPGSWARSAQVSDGGSESD